MVKRYSQGQLASMPKLQIYAIAKDLDIAGRSSMSKKELVRAVMHKLSQTDNAGKLPDQNADVTLQPSAATQSAGVAVPSGVTAQSGVTAPLPADGDVEIIAASRPNELVGDDASVTATSAAPDAREKRVFAVKPAIVHEYQPADTSHLTEETARPDSDRVHGASRHATSAETAITAKARHVSRQMPTQPTPGLFSGELPTVYDRDRLVLQARDPYWAHTYWDFSRATLTMLQARLSAPLSEASFVLRVYDITGRDFPTQEANSFFDERVSFAAMNWYLHLGKPGARFVADLGVVSAGDGFTRVMRSNPVQMPPDKVSQIPAELQWLAVEADWSQPRTFAGDKLPAVSAITVRHAPAEPTGATGATDNTGAATPWSGVGYADALFAPGIPGSFDFANAITSPGANRPERMLDLPTSPGIAQVPSSWSSPTDWNASGDASRDAAEGVTVGGQQVPTPDGPGTTRMGASEQIMQASPSDRDDKRNCNQKNEQGQNLRLKVNTELIVYGATVPGAQVTIQGWPVALRADGTFSARFALPDSEQVIPVQAVSADGSQQCCITPTVCKCTL